MKLKLNVPIIFLILITISILTIILIINTTCNYDNINNCNYQYLKKINSLKQFDSYEILRVNQNNYTNLSKIEEYAFRNYIHIDRNDEEKYDIYFRANLILNSHKISEIKSILISNQPSISSNFSNDFFLIRISQKFHHVGLYNFSNNLLEIAQKIDPNSSESYEFMGRNYIEMNQYDIAKQLIKKAVEVFELKKIEYNNYDGCPYQALGVLYSKLNLTINSTKNFIKAAEIEYYIDYPQYEAALSCFSSSDYKCSLKYINRAIKIKNNSKYYDLKGYTLLMIGNINQAQNKFLISKSNDSIAGLGHIHLIKKDYKNAQKLLNYSYVNLIQKLQKKERIDYISLLAPIGLGWSYSNQNEHDKSIKYYDFVLQIDPINFLALIGKANSLSGLKKYHDANIILDKTLDIYPNNPYALSEKGLILLNLNQSNNSKDLFIEALNLENYTYTCPYEGLGIVYYKQGDFINAKKNLDKSIEINPNIEYKKYNTLAKIYIKEGNISYAKILLNKSIQNFPYNKEAKELLKIINKKNI
jgi:tetratricopeptide (TPR) repeat protein